MNKMARKALIIGCGVAGPVVALFLQQAGIEAEIYEARTESTEYGGSFLNMACNGLDVLKTLKIEEMVSQAGSPIPRMILWSGEGKRLGEVHNGARAEVGAPSVVIMRGRLHQVLRKEAQRQRIKMAFGKKLAGLSTGEQGVKVTADGAVLRVSESAHPDLFWGLRGGGGNFGIVTEFEYRLHPISGQALTVDLFFPLDAAEAALLRWRDLITTAPRQATLTAWTGAAREMSFLPPEVLGRQIASIGYVWVGDPDEGRKLLPSLRSNSSPLAERTREMTYVDLQRMDDSSQEHGVRRYWKGHYFREWSDEAIRAFLTRGMNGRVAHEDAAMMPSASLQSYSGAIADVADDETAFSHRGALAECVISACWADPAEDTKHRALARRYAQSLEPFASGGYIHAMADEGQAGTLRAYNREKLARLTALKDRYDPENVFHLNQNIQPSLPNQA